MASLSDQIEKYLIKLIRQYQGEIEIKRNQLANDFNCAPSQINYVLETRFPLEKGYIVESQRGGGGYIRIFRIKMDASKENIQKIIARLSEPISQREAEAIITRLFENDYISKREKALMNRAVDRRVISVRLPQRDYIRVSILRGMLEIIMQFGDREE